jgi:glycosyltransferase involved in cell wall biosynthesis
MRIVVDGFPIRVGSAGIGTYTSELLGALTRAAPTNEYYLADLGPKLSRAKVSPEPDGSRRHGIVAMLDGVPLIWKAAPPALRRSLIRLETARLGADLYFGTNFLGIFHPRFKTVIAVHDMSHALYPLDAYPPMCRRLVRHLRAHAERADAILTVSEAAKEDVITHLRVMPDKVHAVHNGVSALFRPVTEDAARTACRQRYALPERFLLHVGTLEPRKNLLRVLEAFRLLTEEPWFHHQLVIAGGRGWRDAPILRALTSFPRKDRLSVIGRVSSDDLPILYSMAELLVYPSLYEGFGLPVVEAMACRTPVITSNVSSLPEVAGDAALLVDPESVHEIAAAIERVLTDRDLAASLRRRGVMRATAFSWETAAHRVMELFERVVRR